MTTTLVVQGTWAPSMGEPAFPSLSLGEPKESALTAYCLSQEALLWNPESFACYYSSVFSLRYESFSFAICVCDTICGLPPCGHLWIDRVSLEKSNDSFNFPHFGVYYIPDLSSTSLFPLSHPTHTHIPAHPGESCVPFFSPYPWLLDPKQEGENV